VTLTTINSEVTGALPFANGGHGQTTQTAGFDALAPTTTQGDVIYHNGTDNVRLGNGTAGQLLQTGGAAANPSWATVPACVTQKVYQWDESEGTAVITIGTNGCQATTNFAAVSVRGHCMYLNIDSFPYCKLAYMGALTGAQTGTVTVKLTEYSGGGTTDVITTTFNSGTTCTSRSSAATDLTAQSGTNVYCAQVGDSTAADDPIISPVQLTCCTTSAAVP
jgi:hypothetical protein